MESQPSARIDEKFYDTSEYFDKGLDVFADLKNPFQKYRISKVLELYTPNSQERVIDLGCGWGTFCFSLAPLCQEITGIDFSKKSIELCNRLLEKSDSKNIKFKCADSQNTGLKEADYDVVVCADLMEHCYPEPSVKIIEECARLLKPGGKLLIWTPCRKHFLEKMKNNNIILKKDISHVDYKSMEGLLDLLNQQNFLIKKKYFCESHFPVLNIIEKWLLPIFPIFRRRILILAEKR